ncbi:fluoride efflux transporter CrcB [Gulbenkiania mobilis]|uniref:Fluoride-specific ion channel FluC n=1 Tax=Gulbenkiania mobilis TaxID=397457 RepID=A0ABY2CYD2_GULMO|nr:CrcB protein [Gulbenkiania mobilis]
MPVFAICAGASLGALLRWGLSLGFNRLFPLLPPGTLLANCLGGYLAGLFMAYIAHSPALPAEYRLFIATGFLGGLTTFSTFSMEVVSLIQQGRLGMAAVACTTHLAGALALTFAGFATGHWWWGR